MVGDQGQGAEFILIGEVTKPHGIRGEVKIFPYAGQPENFLDYKTIYLVAAESGQRFPRTVVKSRLQKESVLLTLSATSTRSEAEALVGLKVGIYRADLPPLAEGEYYWGDLLGKRAVTEDGQFLGLVAGLLETAGHDILAIRNGDAEYLIPLHPEFLVRTDAHEVVLKVPPGLLAINSPE